MKGILLAGGSGTRLYPVTKGVCKQLLPVYDKPAIYYPLSILMLAGIREVLIISSPRDLRLIKDLLGDGSEIGMRFLYAEQAQPKGIAEAFKIGADFIGQEPVALVLGDNLFFGQNLTPVLQKAAQRKSGAQVWGYQVQNPEQFGVVEFDMKTLKVKSIEEKPKQPKSKWAVTGLYFYGPEVVPMALGLKPSARGELEITDLNRMFLDKGSLEVDMFGRGVAWLDMGTPETLLSSSQFVQTIESRQGLKVACIEEIALLMGWIDKSRVLELSVKYAGSDYSKYLERVASG